MNKWKPTQTQIEAAARADEWFMDLVDGHCGFDSFGAPVLPPTLPDYANDHNDVQRLIDGLDYVDMRSYIQHLHLITHEHPAPSVIVARLCRATCAQKFEAWCRAKGVE